MTSIAFHFNVPDKLSYGCRLLRKAHAAGAQVVVTGQAAQLAKLDQLLWTFSPLEFLPHKLVGLASQRGDDDPDKLGVTPILLTPSPAACPHTGVLVNLGVEIPDEFGRFDKFIELVTGDADDRAAARQRWKHYATLGYTIGKHDLLIPGGAA